MSLRVLGYLPLRRGLPQLRTMTQRQVVVLLPKTALRSCTAANIRTFAAEAKPAEPSAQQEKPKADEEIPEGEIPADEQIQEPMAAKISRCTLSHLA
jgi:ABC-type uncharacterized transport system involved in gliding motility auxiliary subunit